MALIVPLYITQPLCSRRGCVRFACVRLYGAQSHFDAVSDIDPDRGPGLAGIIADGRELHSSGPS
jgi:hypothetical protein